MTGRYQGWQRDDRRPWWGAEVSEGSQRALEDTTVRGHVYTAKVVAKHRKEQMTQSGAGLWMPCRLCLLGETQRILA